MRKSVLMSIVIFACGVAAGFFAGKKYYEEYYADLAQEEIDSVKETFSRRGELVLIKNDNGISEDDYDESFRTAPNPLSRSSLDGNPYEQAKRNYTLIGKNPETGEENITIPMPNEIMVDRTKPYVIDAHEFSEEFDQHDKVSLYYYREDDVLSAENEELVDNIEETVGYDALAILDNQTTVWVRNEPLCIDYEIIAINKSFGETVHGITRKKTCSKCGKELNLLSGLSRKHDLCRECSRGPESSDVIDKKALKRGKKNEDKIL
jgi:hypothetical protein